MGVLQWKCSMLVIRIKMVAFRGLQGRDELSVNLKGIFVLVNPLKKGHPNCCWYDVL